MKTLDRLATTLTILAVAGCSGSAPLATPSTPSAGAPSATPSSVAATPSAPATAAPVAQPSPTLAVALTCKAGVGEVALVIDGKANLFGAGFEKPPAPAGGGAGALPPFVELPAGDARFIEIPCTAGQVNCCFGEPTTWADPEGTAAFKTDIDSHGGISGIIVGDRSIFLAGVFLTDAPPQEPAPERLDQTGTATFDGFEPEIAQTFLIGSGSNSRWAIPAGATRLFLGIMDAYFTSGPPGWYGNNSGAFEATVRVIVE